MGLPGRLSGYRSSVRTAFPRAVGRQCRVCMDAHNRFFMNGLDLHITYTKFLPRVHRHFTVHPLPLGY